MACAGLGDTTLPLGTAVGNESVDSAINMKIHIELEVAPDEVPMASELLAILR